MHTEEKKGPVQQVVVELPPWVEAAVDAKKKYDSDEEKMALALWLAAENVRQDTGGPFGSAIFDQESGRLLGVGVNRVFPLNNATLHGEMVAIMMAQKALASFTLHGPGKTRELFTSCEPCAMCLGAILWSGVSRVVCAAAAEDARAIGFDEGPVFDASYAYLENAGIRVIRHFMAEEGREVLESYSSKGGVIYNARN
ncbi:nucleoside deaminase [Desulfobotulus mexicanus]|uniref:Nucleoside deaminase n=1 Tax=Desulfobotulus mexicanus TaxID=2586642 RepID=A0A5Q4VGE1_9BACT|nr:nucleoside deaminase [Desulfobotulus mexicanus]TYT75200.1 nucleoside deaminase [Desulfobotulus mexicanus]